MVHHETPIQTTIDDSFMDFHCYTLSHNHVIQSIPDNEFINVISYFLDSGLSTFQRHWTIPLSQQNRSYLSWMYFDVDKLLETNTNIAMKR